MVFLGPSYVLLMGRKTLNVGGAWPFNILCGQDVGSEKSVPIAECYLLEYQYPAIKLLGVVTHKTTP
jgi:hypothetical protein